MNNEWVEKIYQEYFNRIYNYVYYRTLNKEVTEDVVSETFLRVVGKLNLFDEKKGNLSAWIYTICKHCLIDYYRKNPLCANIEDHTHLSTMDRELERIENETEKTLYQALALLSERERIIFYYKYYMGHTNRAIAQQMCIPESTVGTIVHRAHQKIKQNIDFTFG